VTASPNNDNKDEQINHNPGDDNLSKESPAYLSEEDDARASDQELYLRAAMTYRTVLKLLEDYWNGRIPRISHFEAGHVWWAGKHHLTADILERVNDLKFRFIQSDPLQKLEIDKKELEVLWSVVRFTLTDKLAQYATLFRISPVPLHAIAKELRKKHFVAALSTIDSIILAINVRIEIEKQGTESPQQNEQHRTLSHSPDFTSVNWFGQWFTFAKGQQAAVVRILWEEWEVGSHTLSIETIEERLEEAGLRTGSSQFRLDHVFRNRKGPGYHPAWDTMIKQVEKGIYMLYPPTNTE